MAAQDNVEILVQRKVLKEALAVAKAFVDPLNYSQAIRRERTIKKLKALLEKGRES